MDREALLARSSSIADSLTDLHRATAQFVLEMAISLNSLRPEIDLALLGAQVAQLAQRADESDEKA